MRLRERTTVVVDSGDKELGWDEQNRQNDERHREEEGKNKIRNTGIQMSWRTDGRTDGQAVILTSSSTASFTVVFGSGLYSWECTVRLEEESLYP